VDDGHLIAVVVAPIVGSDQDAQACNPIRWPVSMVSVSVSRVAEVFGSELMNGRGVDFD
jgi:hypothetical protein